MSNSIRLLDHVLRGAVRSALVALLAVALTAVEVIGPAGIGPAGIGPAGIGPAGIGPAGIGPAGIGPAVIGPAVIGPAGIGPAGAQQLPGRIRFVPESADASVRVEARFAPKPDECPANQPRNLLAAYPGVLEVGRRADGRLYLVTELSFPSYLKGIDEMPRSWPLEALKAQVVAARTYAMSHLDPSTALARELNFNLCATDACQVYRGLKVERGPWGEAWSRAVDETAGQILQYNGSPASTFYFSTSNGHTYSTKEAFGGGALPYIRPVKETDDSASPVSRWSVRMPLADLGEALRRAGVWGPGPVEQVVQDGVDVRLSGDGKTVSMPIVELRKRLNKEAVCLEPKRYPTPGANGRPLPQVVPSRWVQTRQEGTDVVMDGRGWGHGAGMVQWGARGKAERGLGYSNILAFYYGGLTPVRRPEPGKIRIGLAVDVEELTVERVGPVRAEGISLRQDRVVIRGGSGMTVSQGPPIAPVLRLENVSTTGAAAPGSPITFSFELSAPAKVAIRYRRPDGVETETRPEPLDRGPQTLRWEDSSLPRQRYQAVLVADDGVAQVLSAPLEVAFLSPSVSSGSSKAPGAGRASPPKTQRIPAPARFAMLGAGIVAAGLGLLALGIRRRRRRAG